MRFRSDGLSDPKTIALLETHLKEMSRHSPPESVHALDMEELSGSDVDFWTVWDGSDLLGCGALKRLDETHCEVKSMHTVMAHRGRGVAAGLLEHLIAEARRLGCSAMSLETGSADAFAPARALYAGFGFETCGPFADYRHDPHSVYMTLDLSATNPGSV